MQGKLFHPESDQCMEFPPTESCIQPRLYMSEFKRELDSYWKEEKIGYGVKKAKPI